MMNISISFFCRQKCKSTTVGFQKFIILGIYLAIDVISYVKARRRVGFIFQLIEFECHQLSQHVGYYKYKVYKHISDKL